MQRHAPDRPRNADRADDLAREVAHAAGHAADLGVELSVVVSETGLAHARQLPGEQVGVRDGLRRQLRQRMVRQIPLQLLGAHSGEDHLAEGGGVARPDAAVALLQLEGARARAARDDHDIVARHHREMGALAGLLRELLEDRSGDRHEIDLVARIRGDAEDHAPDVIALALRVLPDIAEGRHRPRQMIGRAGVEPDAAAEFRQADPLGMGRDLLEYCEGANERLHARLVARILPTSDAPGLIRVNDRHSCASTPMLQWPCRAERPPLSTVPGPGSPRGASTCEGFVRNLARSGKRRLLST